MKLTLLFLLTAIYTQAQAPKFKDADSRCTTGHKCSVRYYVDEFEGFTCYSDGLKLTKMNGFGEYLGVSLYRYDYINTRDVYYVSFQGMQKGCVVSDLAYVMLILKNGEKITLPYVGSLDCGVGAIRVPISDEVIEKLSTNVIDKIRLRYTQNQEDFTASEKGQKAFIETLQCLQGMKTEKPD